MGVSLDITERKRMETQLRERLQEIEIHNCGYNRNRWN